MLSYELLARCRLLTLVGQKADGGLEWFGTREELQALDSLQRKIVVDGE